MNITNKQSSTDKNHQPLSDFLESERAGEEALDFIGVHGFLTAIVICPEKVDSNEWLQALFYGRPNYLDKKEETTITQLLIQLVKEIEINLSSGELLTLPCATDTGENPSLQSWCLGFIEALYLREAVWFKSNEEVIAELTLPVMTLSGVIEHEFSEISDNNNMMIEFSQQLPETLTDLYLLYRSPPKKQPNL